MSAGSKPVACWGRVREGSWSHARTVEAYHGVVVTNRHDGRRVVE